MTCERPLASAESALGASRFWSLSISSMAATRSLFLAWTFRAAALKAARSMPDLVRKSLSAMYSLSFFTSSASSAATMGANLGACLASRGSILKAFHESKDLSSA